MTSPFRQKYGLTGDSTPKADSTLSDFRKKYGLTGAPDTYLDQEQDEDEDLFDYIGSMAKYMWNLAKEPDGHIFTKGGRDKLAANTLRLSDATAQIGAKIGASTNQLTNWFSDTPASKMGPEAWQRLKETGSEGIKQFLSTDFTAPAVAQSLLKMFIETPVNAVTQTKREPDGSFRISTANDLAQDIQSTLGAVVNISLTRGIAKKMLPTGNTTAETLKLAAGSKSGKMFRAWKANVIGGIPGGAAQGAIEALGDPEIDKRIVVSALGNLPLATMFSVLDYRGYTKDLARAKGEVINKSQAAASALRAMRELEAQAGDSFDTLNGKVYGFITGDDAHRAVVNSKLYNGEPYVAVGLSEERLAEFSQAMDGLDAQRAKPIEYNPSDEVGYLLNKSKRKIGGVELRFATPLDQAAYTVAGSARKKLLPSHEKILNDVSNATGLSHEAIISHGESLRETARKAIEDPSARSARPQTEIDEITNKMISRGKTKIASMANGETVKDATGEKWMRDGDALVSASGFRYPINSNEATLIIGRAEAGIIPEHGVIKLGEEAWNPVFGRTVDTKYEMVRGPNQKTLFVPDGSLSDGQRKIFTQTGTVRGQRVTLADGTEGVVNGVGDNGQVKIRIGNKHISTDPSNVMDTGKIKLKDSSMDVVSQRSLTDKIYNDFKSSYDLVKANNDGVDSVIEKVLSDNEVPVAAREAMVEHVYSRLYDDVRKLATEDEAGELALYESMRDKLAESVSSRLANQEDAVNSALRASELYLGQNGSSFEIRSLKDGTKLANVGSLKEAYDFAITSGSPVRPALLSNTPFPLDGISAVGTSWKPKSGGESTWIDRMFSRRSLLKAIAPTGNMFLRFDASIKDMTGVDSNLFTIYRSIDDAMIQYRRAIHQLEPATKLYSKALDLKHSIEPSRQHLITGWLEAMSQQEIITKGFGRAANATEIQFAKQLAETGVGQNDIAFTIHATSKATKVKGVGSQEFGAALDQMVGKKVEGRVITKEMVQAAKLINNSPLGQNLSTFSPALVMKLSDSYIDPINAIDRSTYALRHKLTKKEMEVATALDQMYNEAAPLLGITADRRILSYSPHMRMNSLLGLQFADPTGSKAFTSDLHRLGILGNDELILTDPFVVAFRYLTGGAKKISGFDRIETDGASRVTQIAEQLAASGNADQIRLGVGLQGYYDDYIKSALGIPDHNAQLSRAFDEVNRFFGIRRKLSDKFEGTAIGKVIDASAIKDPTNTVMSVVEAALQGGRPLFAVRDYFTSIGNLWINFGAKFTGEVMGASLDGKYMQELIDQGVLPSLTVDDFIAPSRAGSLAAGKGVVKKMADTAMNLTLQRQVYNYTAAGIYKVTTKRARAVLSDYVKGEIDFDSVIDKLDLDLHGKSFVRQFNDVMVRGNVDAAAHMLGKWNVKKMVNSWGHGNNPRGWNTTPGRLFGMYGSWGVNELQTLIDAFSNASPKKAALRAARFGAFTMGIAQIGQETDMDLRSWMINPFKMFPTGGPILNFGQDVLEGAQQAFDGALEGELTIDKLAKLMPFTTGESVGRPYIPYSMAVQDWITAYNLLEEGKPGEAALRGTLGIRGQ